MTCACLHHRIRGAPRCPHWAQARTAAVQVQDSTLSHRCRFPVGLRRVYTHSFSIVTRTLGALFICISSSNPGMAAAVEEVPVPPQYKPQSLYDFRQFPHETRGFKVGVTKYGKVGTKRKLEEYAEQVGLGRAD